MGKCPYCGGTKGFELKEYGITMKYAGRWGDSEMRFVNVTRFHATPKFVKCMDCGRKILKSRVLGKE